MKVFSISNNGLAGIVFSVGSSTRFPSVSSLSSLTSVAGVFEGSKTVTEAVLLSPPAFMIL